MKLKKGEITKPRKRTIENLKSKIVQDLENRKFLTQFFKEHKTQKQNETMKKGVPLFGVSLQAVIEMYNREIDIPPPVSICVDFLLENKFESTVGLFRIPGNSILIENVKSTWSFGKPSPLCVTQKDSAHNAATILKQYFASLPETLFPPTTWDQFQLLIGILFTIYFI